MKQNSCVLLLSLLVILHIITIIQHAQGQEDQFSVPATCPDNRTRITTSADSGTTTIGNLLASGDLFFNSANFESNRSNISLTAFYYNTSGIYLMSTPVPSPGRITNITIYGYLSDENLIRANQNENGINVPGFNLFVLPFANAVVYRLDSESNLYRLMRMSDPITHIIAPGSLAPGLTLNWPVEEGDRIGVLIPDMCDEQSNPVTCPSQVNLRVSADECLSALFYNPFDADSDDLSSIDANLFEEVPVRLNMAATIEPNDVLVIEWVVLGCCIVALICAMVLLCGCCFRRLRLNRRGTSKSRHKKELCDMGDGTSAVPTTQPHEYYYISDLSSGEPPPSNTTTPYIHATDLHPELNIDGYELDGYEQDTDCQEPFWEPANREEDLIFELNTKLSVPEIPRDNLKFYEVLGSGAFGTVQRAVWQRHNVETDQLSEEEVAVKTMEGGASEEDRIKFLQEAVIMGQFDYPNIVAIRGISTDQPLMIVVDLLRGGDLRNHLLTKVRQNISSSDPFELGSTLLSYTRQIALGLLYLNKKAFVHRDLAARNILLSEDAMTCKIADFGLSRDLQQENFYVSHGGKIPVKWTAPEALKYRIYSHASDVWSYGIVLYEIWSLGEKPFKELTNPEAIQRIEAGYRLPPPPGCSRTLYDLMMQCWHPDCDERPSSYDILQQLQQSDFHILRWTPEDTAKYGEDVRTIGAPLELGKRLYREKQNIYLVHSD